MLPLPGASTGHTPARPCLPAHSTTPHMESRATQELHQSVLPPSPISGPRIRLRRGPWPWHATPHSSDTVGVLSLCCCAQDLHTRLGSFSLENLILGLTLPCYLYPVNNSPPSEPEHTLSTPQPCTGCPTSYSLLVTLVPCTSQQRQTHQVPGRSERVRCPCEWGAPEVRTSPPWLSQQWP